MIIYMQEMFLRSAKLKEKIKIISDQIEHESFGLASFEEYIGLPYYGQIILRFDLKKEVVTLTELDCLEKVMRSCADDFLVDFMGDVYKKVGFNTDELPTLLDKCQRFYPDLDLKTPYKEVLAKDADILFEICGIDKRDVWEIQIDDNDIAMILLDSVDRRFKSVKAQGAKIDMFLAKRSRCQGLMRAMAYAIKNDISLIHALLKVSDRI